MPEFTETPNQAYNRHVLEWRKMALDYGEVVEQAADAEAKWKQARAKLIVKAKHEDPKVSAVLSEAIADADDEVGKLALQRFVLSARVDAGKKMLEWARAYGDNLRTQVVDARAENAFMSQVGAGPGRGMVDPGTGEVFGSGQAPRNGPQRPSPPPPADEYPPLPDMPPDDPYGPPPRRGTTY